MTTGLLETGLMGLFAFCVCYAVVSDFRHLKIPNWIPLALTAAFAVYAAAALEPSGVASRLLLAAIVFMVAFAFFAARWLGGGDVKLLAALVLWMGPEGTGAFVMLMAAIGAGLAAALMLARSPLARGWVEGSSVLGRLVELGERGECPYGVAIGLAALVMGPALFLPG